MLINQVISARKGEFETGYERGGQTREHVQLAKTLGVTKLLVVVNKMDDPTVNWSKERLELSLSLSLCFYELTWNCNEISYWWCSIRYDEIESKMVPFLKQSGYNVKKGIFCLLYAEECGNLLFCLSV
jgi:peptide chain release factor subunit 3